MSNFASRISRFVRGLLEEPARSDGHSRDFLLDFFPKGSIGAEIGVYKGDFSALIISGVDPACLHLVDPWRYESDEQYADSWYGGKAGGNQAVMDQIHDSVIDRFKAEIERGVVKVHRSSSSDAVIRFPDDHFDWVYIDGNHSYPFVSQDLANFLPKVKPGGIIAGDDYGPGGWWKDGVIRAVDEFIAAGRCELVTIRARQYVLRKP